SRVAARIGRAEFFAPEMRISPSRRMPPVMISLSMDVPVTRRPEGLSKGRRSRWRRARPWYEWMSPAGARSGAPGPVDTTEEFHGDGVNAAVGDPGIEMSIDLLLALDRAQAGQLVADHVELEVAAFAFHFHLGSRKLLFQEILHF